MSKILKAFSIGKSKHKKLPEDWGETIKEPVNEGITFYVKYLGSTLVEEPSSDVLTAEAIKTIIAMAKTSGKKLMRVALLVKPTGIATFSADTKEQHLDISIYRISYCSADATYSQVVAFIATNKNETYECHAFLTSKRKVAQAAALTISQAFTIAFEKWKKQRNDGDKSPSSPSSSASTPSKEDINNSENRNENIEKKETEPTLIDFSTDLEQGQKTTGFDGNDSFLRFIESRITTENNAPLLPTNLSYNNIQDLNQFIKSKENENEEKFFSQNTVDDLLSL